MRRLSVFILIRRAAAFAAMRPTLLFKLEENAARRKRNWSWSVCAGVAMKRKYLGLIKVMLEHAQVLEHTRMYRTRVTGR